MCVCLCLLFYLPLLLHKRMCTHSLSYTLTHTHIHTHIHMLTHTHTCTHMLTHTRTCTHTHTHTHTHKQVYNILLNARYGDEDDQIGLLRLLSNKTFTAGFPLHEVRYLFVAFISYYNFQVGKETILYNSKHNYIAISVCFLH